MRVTSGGYYGCDTFSSYQDVIYCSWEKRGPYTTLENWYVDEFGWKTSCFIDETYEPEQKSFGIPPYIAWYRCNACRQRFDDDWQEVLDHFPTNEDDNEGENADSWE